MAKANTLLVVLLFAQFSAVLCQDTASTEDTIKPSESTPSIDPSAATTGTISTSTGSSTGITDISTTGTISTSTGSSTGITNISTTATETSNATSLPTSSATTDSTSTTTTNASSSLPLTTTIANTSAPTTVASESTSVAHTADEKERRFDAPSFIGGIILALGLLAIAYVGYKFYRARTEHNYHTLLLVEGRPAPPSNPIV